MCSLIPSVAGYIGARNRLVDAADAELVLLLDDDARLLTAEAVDRAIQTLRHDPRIGAIAFAQAEADGRPWPTACCRLAPRATSLFRLHRVAHLLRRSVFQEVGGYRESFGFYGEEKDLPATPGGRVSHGLPA